MAEVVRVDRSGPKPSIAREKLLPAPDAHEPLRLEQEALAAAVRGAPSAGVTGEEGRRALAAALQVLDAMARHSDRVAVLRGITPT